jgi:hypothetical protein
MSAVAATGARRSVERLFAVKAASERTALSDIVFGLDNTAPWQVVTGPVLGQKRLGLRVELGAADTRPSSVVKLMVGRTGGSEWIEQKDLTIRGEGGALSAAGAINISQLERGRYTARIELWRSGSMVGSTSKIFDIR